MKTLIAALKVLAGVEDTDYPYYHVSNHPETPTIRSGGKIYKDPDGIFLFYKGKDVNQTDWKPKKYRWDAKLKKEPMDVIDLNYDDLLAKVGIKDVNSFIENLHPTKDYGGVNKSSLEDDYENFLEEEETFLWADIGYPLLRAHFNDPNKFRQFLLNNGVHSLADSAGHTVFYGEPQLIVFDPSKIEWGPREKNVSDNKIYVLAGTKEDLIEKAEEVVKKNSYLNCRLFTQLVTDTPAIEKQPLLKKIETGAILWWGTEQNYSHCAVALDEKTLIQVPEWGGKSEVVTIKEVEKEYGPIDKIYKPN